MSLRHRIVPPRSLTKRRVGPTQRHLIREVRRDGLDLGSLGGRDHRRCGAGVPAGVHHPERPVGKGLIIQRTRAYAARRSSTARSGRRCPACRGRGVATHLAATPPCAPIEMSQPTSFLVHRTNDRTATAGSEGCNCDAPPFPGGRGRQSSFQPKAGFTFATLALTRWMPLSQSSALLDGRAVRPPSSVRSRAVLCQTRPTGRQAVASNSSCAAVSNTPANPSGSPPLPSRTCRYRCSEIVLDAESCRCSPMMEVTIFTTPQVAKATELRVQGGAEAEACAVDRPEFGRIALRPTTYRCALLGNADPPRPQIHTGCVCVDLDRQPVPRYLRIGIRGRQPDLCRILVRPAGQKSHASGVPGQADASECSIYDQSAVPGSPGARDGRAGVAAIVEDNSHPARDGRYQRVDSHLERFERAGSSSSSSWTGSTIPTAPIDLPRILSTHRRSQTSSTNSSSRWWTTVTRPGISAMIW